MKTKEGNIKLNEYDERLPSVLEIMVGIQKEEMKNQLNLNHNEKPEFIHAVTCNMMVVWKEIFKIGLVIDFNTPLTYR